MGYDKQLLEKFSKDLKEPVKTNGNIPQTPEISKNVSSAGNEKSGPHKDLSASMIDSKSVTQFGIPKGQTPFFVFTSVVVLILIAIFYFMKTQKDKEVEESEKKDKEELSRLSKDKIITSESILNSGTSKILKRAVTLFTIIFFMVFILYGLTLLFKQIKKMEMVVMS